MSLIKTKVITEFDLAWNDVGSGAPLSCAFYNPKTVSGYYSMGSYGQANHQSPTGSVLIVREVEVGSGAIAFPDRFERVYSDVGTGSDLSGSFWKPIPPANYVAMGLVCVSGYEPPSVEGVVCLRSDLLTTSEFGKLIWDDRKSDGDEDGSFWEIHAVTSTVQTGLFTGAQSYNQGDALAPVSIKGKVISYD